MYLLTGNAENCQSERDEASVANTGNGGHQQTIDCKDLEKSKQYIKRNSFMSRCLKIYIFFQIKKFCAL